jgi:hypothetical protein
VIENRNEGVLVKAEPLAWAEEVSHRMVDVVCVDDDALLLEVGPEWAEAIEAVLETKGVLVKEIRKQTTAERLIAEAKPWSHESDEERTDHRW